MKSDKDILPITIETESVTFDVVSSGEWEIQINKADGDKIYHYEYLPDQLFDQLREQGEIDLE